MKKYNIYRYRGPEVPLAELPATATGMTIDFLEFDGNVATAKGDFSIRDHMEGSEGNDPWVATGIHIEKGVYNWTVKRKTPENGDFCFNDKSGEPLFTLLLSVNDAIKAFIATKLDYVINKLLTSPEITEITDESKKFVGVMHEYTGPCVCDGLLASNIKRPFDWNTYTNNGQYPKNCFECSCGNKWYRGDDQMWAQVGNNETWLMLTTHDGEVVEPVGIDPEANKVPTIVLLKNIRSRGYIPIG